MSRRPNNEPETAGPPSPLRAHGALIVAGAALFLLIVAAYVDVTATSNSTHPITGAFGLAVLVIGFLTDGLFLLAYLLGAAAMGSVILRAIVRKPAGFLTSAALGTGLLSLLSLGLGCAGALNQITSIVLLTLGPILWTATRLRSFSQLSTQHSALSPSSWLWLLTVPALALAACCASMFPGAIWQGMDPHPYDVMSYHLQIPREWYEAGRIFRLDHNAYSNFPFLMEVQFLTFMHLRGGPWEAMYACQFFSLLCMVLSVAACASCAREMGASHPGSIMAGVLVASVPWIVCLGSVCFNESLLLLYFTLCLQWTARGLRDKPDLRALAVAGAMAGLACGVKYTGAPVVAVFVPVSVIAARLLARNVPAASFKQWAAGAGVYSLSVLLVFSPWLIRNLAWTGNVVYPMAMRTLGSAGYSNQQVERWDRAHRAVAAESSLGGRVKAFITRVPFDWQYGYLILPLGIVSAVLLACRLRFSPSSLCHGGLAPPCEGENRDSRNSTAGQARRGTSSVVLLGAISLILLFLLQLLFWLFFTHLMPRFAILLVPICAILAGVAFSGSRQLHIIGISVTALATIVGLVLIHHAFAVEVRGIISNTFLEQGRAGIWRLNEPDVLNPREIEKLPPETPLALIGDAQAFYHRRPMSHLRYRMIFDVDFAPGASPIDAWLGTPESELRKTHAVLVHPGEIRRLSRTYFGVPGLPDSPIPPGYSSPLEGGRVPTGLPWSRASDFPHLHVPEKQ